MRQACPDTYPDPQHHMRQNIMRMDSHSSRVTATVTLSNAVLSINEIAFQLWWKPESVEHYLRDCARAIGQLTEAAIRGSFVILKGCIYIFFLCIFLSTICFFLHFSLCFFMLSYCPKFDLFFFIVINLAPVIWSYENQASILRDSMLPYIGRLLDL
jgi:hypothetical protein